MADVFIYLYETDFLDSLLSSGNRRLAKSFNFCYRYMDDLAVFSNTEFNIEHAKEIHPLIAEEANRSGDHASKLPGHDIHCR